MTKSKSIAISLLTLLIIGLILCCGQGQRDTKTGRSEDTLKGNISISGAFALYPMTVKWAEEFQKLHPNVQIDISAGGAGKGMTDVLSNMVDLAMFSREVSKQEEEKGAWKIAVAKDAVFPTINQENPAKVQILKKGLTKEQFRKLFTNEDQPRWDQFEGFDIPVMINVYTRSDACGAAAMWAGYFGKEQEDLRGIGVFGDPGMADAVKKDKNGVGYNNLIYIYDMKTNKAAEGLNIIPIDLDGNRTIDHEEDIYQTMNSAMEAIKNGQYPSPPARNLYLISNGKPDNEAVLAFLRYILTDGQKLVPEAGYVELNKNKIQDEKTKLNIPL